MRLESQRGNWVRVRVGGRKINRGYLKEEGNSVSPSSSCSTSRLIDPSLSFLCCLPQDLKLRYYDLIIALALEEDAFLDACKAYQEVYDTEEVKKDEARAQQVRLLPPSHRRSSKLILAFVWLMIQVLEMITYFIVLAPHDNEQSDMVHKLALKPEIEKLALHQFVPVLISPPLLRSSELTSVCLSFSFSQ